MAEIFSSGWRHGAAPHVTRYDTGFATTATGSAAATGTAAAATAAATGTAVATARGCCGGIITLNTWPPTTPKDGQSARA